MLNITSISDLGRRLLPIALQPMAKVVVHFIRKRVRFVNREVRLFKSKTFVEHYRDVSGLLKLFGTRLTERVVAYKNTIVLLWRFRNYKAIRKQILSADSNLVSTITTLKGESLYNPYMTFSPESRTMQINIDIGGLPGCAQERFISVKKAVIVLQNSRAKNIVFYYQDKWGLLPVPPIKTLLDLSDFRQFAAKKPNEFLELFRIMQTK